MTPDDQSRAREICEKWIDPSAISQTDESLRELANDIGVITSPAMRIAASVAVELLVCRDLFPKALAHIAALERALGSFVEYFDAIEAGALNHNRRTAPLRTVEQIYLDRGRELLGWKKREASGE